MLLGTVYLIEKDKSVLYLTLYMYTYFIIMLKFVSHVPKTGQPVVIIGGGVRCYTKSIILIVCRSTGSGFKCGSLFLLETDY